MLTAWVADTAPAVLESVTLTVKYVVPVAPVGVPAIAPVLELMLNPVGNDPLVIENASAPVPPVTPIVWL
jgi:hypothetical protein